MQMMLGGGGVLRGESGGRRVVRRDRRLADLADLAGLVGLGRTGPRGLQKVRGLLRGLNGPVEGNPLGWRPGRLLLVQRVPLVLQERPLLLLLSCTAVLQGFKSGDGARCWVRLYYLGLELVVHRVSGNGAG